MTVQGISDGDHWRDWAGYGQHCEAGGRYRVASAAYDRALEGARRDNDVSARVVADLKIAADRNEGLAVEKAAATDRRPGDGR